jgi:hypothetical protein
VRVLGERAGFAVHVGLHRLDEAQVDEPLDRAERFGRAGRELLRERLVKTREFREGDVDR